MKNLVLILFVIFFSNGVFAQDVYKKRYYVKDKIKYELTHKASIRKCKKNCEEQDRKKCKKECKKSFTRTDTLCLTKQIE